MTNISTNITGAKCELVACAWLLELGYQVFRNVAPSGNIDLVAIRDNEVIYIDVAKVPYLKSKDDSIVYGRAKTKEERAKRNGIKVLYVDGNNCFFMSDDFGIERTCSVCLKKFIGNLSNTTYCKKECRDSGKKALREKANAKK